jgi:hypothetical protein
MGEKMPMSGNRSRPENDTNNPLSHAARVMGKKGREVNSEDQARASRENGHKGGRPREDGK